MKTKHVKTDKFKFNNTPCVNFSGNYPIVRNNNENNNQLITTQPKRTFDLPAIVVI